MASTPTFSTHGSFLVTRTFALLACLTGTILACSEAE